MESEDQSGVTNACVSSQQNRQGVADSKDGKNDQAQSTDFNSDHSTEPSSPTTVLGEPSLILSSDSSNNGSRRSTASSVEKHTTSSVEKHTTSSVAAHLAALFHAWRSKSIKRLSTFPPIGQSAWRRKTFRRLVAVPHQLEADDDTGIVGLLSAGGKVSWRSFDYHELASATDNFSDDRLIGKGGHAKVYKGCLDDGQLVAIKKLSKGKSDEERVGDFLSELGIVAHINHPNAARLIGFGIEGGLHLVLQFSSHGSLASMLHGPREKLEWVLRYKIALGTAQGLAYLHEGCQRRIIHRDIKASNILLTDDYKPQISDFGLAKWLPDQWTQLIVSPIEGTFGYLAPEYFMHGVVDEKIDVFAFGILLLELLTGKRAVDSCRQSLLLWAKPLLETRNASELADPYLGDDYDPIQMDWLLLTASMCVHHLAASRPRMSQVVSLLKGEKAVMESVGTTQHKSSSGRTLLLNALDVDEYTSSRYLNDLSRHKQLAMEF